MACPGSASYSHSQNINSHNAHYSMHTTIAVTLSITGGLGDVLKGRCKWSGGWLLRHPLCLSAANLTIERTENIYDAAKNMALFSCSHEVKRYCGTLQRPRSSWAQRQAWARHLQDRHPMLLQTLSCS